MAKPVPGGISATVPAKDCKRAGVPLDRNFTAPAPNLVWTADLTCTRRHWCAPVNVGIFPIAEPNPTFAYYSTYSPNPVPLHTLVKVKDAGQRGASKNASRPAKVSPGSIGNRSGGGQPVTAWSPSRCSRAFLSVITAAEQAARPSPDVLIPVAVNELDRLVEALLLRPNNNPIRLQQ